MKVRLKNVRLAFPNLFEPRAAQKPGDKPKYGTIAIYSDASRAQVSDGNGPYGPEMPVSEALKKAMEPVAKAKWGAKAGDVYKSLKAQNKTVIHDGAEKAQYAGFEGNHYISAANSIRPPVVDSDGRTPLTISDGKPYAGAYATVVVELWAQDNQYGKRLNASLMGVQFLRDGERLAGGAVASEDDFEAIPEEEGAAVFGGNDKSPAEVQTDPFA